MLKSGKVYFFCFWKGLNKASERTPFRKVRFVKGPEGGELCSYPVVQHPRQWNSNCKGYKVSVCWNEHGTARKGS